MADIPRRSPVVIVGGGPAGSLLAILLHQGGVESVIVELRSRDYVLGRIRAGVLEQGSSDILHQAGMGTRMDHDGFVHRGVNIAFAGRMLRVDFDGLTGKCVTIYGQTEVQKDLYQAIDQVGVPLIDEAEWVTLHDIEGPDPRVSFRREGQDHSIEAEFVIGCDGAHGVCRGYLPAESTRTFERIYPFGWLGILSETPPVNDELIYANHDRGFALCSMRNENLSRYYIQCPLDTEIEEWPDDRFWEELAARLPEETGNRLVTGPSIEKSITPLRSFVSEPMRHGRLLLAGDASHIVPPTGAKGLNLAISDVVYLAEALIDHFAHRADSGLDTYSDRASDRAWKAVRFSWWMTTMLHRFPEMEDEFDRRLQRAELAYLFDSVNAQRAMAENYVGLPL